MGSAKKRVGCVAKFRLACPGLRTSGSRPLFNGRLLGPGFAVTASQLGCRGDTYRSFRQHVSCGAGQLPAALGDQPETDAAPLS